MDRTAVGGGEGGDDDQRRAERMARVLTAFKGKGVGQAAALEGAGASLGLLVVRVGEFSSFERVSANERDWSDRSALLELLAGSQVLAFVLASMLADERGCAVEDVLADAGSRIGRLAPGD